MRYLVETELLQSFMTVAEEFNFRRAAERLHIDQSALTRRIQKLEGQLGCELFARSTREVRLTEAGHAFYRDNLPTLARLEAAVLHARRVAAGKTGHLRIGYMSFAAIAAMPHAVRAFRAAHPAISVAITYIRTQGQKIALARNEIDVGFMIGPFAHPDFLTHTISRERLVAVLPQGHALAAKPHLTLRDLARYEIILGDLAQWEFYRALIADLFGAQGLTLHATLEASTTLGILGLVAAGQGVSLYPEGLRTVAPRHVVLREIDDCDGHIETILAWRRDRSDPALTQFIACCAAAAPPAAEPR